MNLRKIAVEAATWAAALKTAGELSDTQLSELIHYRRKELDLRELFGDDVADERGALYQLTLSLRKRGTYQKQRGTNYWVSQETVNKKKYWHVWQDGLTQATCVGAFEHLDDAVQYCRFLRE